MSRQADWRPAAVTDQEAAKILGCGVCVWQDQNEENGHVRMRTIRGMHGDARRAR